MMNPYKFIPLKHGEVVMLPKKFEVPAVGVQFDCIQLAGDHIVFALSTGTHLENGKGEMKTLRELYEEQEGKK